MKLARSGFSLMEMLMVLLVIALLSMSFFAFKQRGMEVDKAEDLGFRLYEYGQALGDYLRTEGRNYAHKPDDPTEIVYEGYAWLQEKLNPEGQPYLSKEFSLVVDPLYIENIPGEKTPLLTELSVFHDPATNTYHLQLDLITVGPVYSRNDYTTDEEGVRTNFQDVSLIARAVNYANEYRDTIKGSGIIQYQRVEEGAQQPPAQPPGTEPPPAFQTPSIIQGTLVDQSIWNDAWLLRSGQNTMQGPIRFDTSASQDSAIQNVDNIMFQSAGTGTVQNVNVINFGSSGAINALQALNFGSGGDINNVDQINFDPNGAGVINFPKTSQGEPVIFKGLRPIGGTGKYGTSNEYILDYQKNKISIKGNFCFVTSFTVPSVGGFQCSVSTQADGGGTWYTIITLMESSGGACFVSCYGY